MEYDSWLGEVFGPPCVFSPQGPRAWICMLGHGISLSSSSTCSDRTASTWPAFRVFGSSNFLEVSDPEDQLRMRAAWRSHSFKLQDSWRGLNWRIHSFYMFLWLHIPYRLWLHTSWSRNLQFTNMATEHRHSKLWTSSSNENVPLP